MARTCKNLSGWSTILIFIVIVSFKAQGMVSQYPRLINLAELEITKQDFKQALVYYDSAFNSVSSPFVQDLYNGALCAIESGNFPRAVEISKRVATKGVGESFFKKSNAFRPLKSQKGWEELIELAKRSKQKLDSNKTNRIIEGLLQKSDMTDSAFYANFDPDKEFPRAVTADSLSRKLLNIFINEGYPSEEVIGADVINDTLLSALPKYAILLSRRSLLVNPDIDSIFKKILWDLGVKEGKLKADAYISVTQHSLIQTETELRNYYAWVDCTLYRPKTLSKQQVDSFRSLAGACTLEDYTQKLIYTIKHPGSGFLIITTEVNQGPYYRNHPDELTRFLTGYELETNINNGCPY